jgi:hypothetical protein
MSDMNEWAKAKADAIKPRLDELRAQDEKSVDDQKHKRMQEALVWEAISAKALEGCNAVNLQLGRPLLTWSRDADKNIVVRGYAGPKGAEVIAKFAPEECAITWDLRRYDGVIDAAGRLVFGMGSTDNPALDAEGMGKEIVDAALDKLKEPS